jgi:hypothetical protein
VYLTGGVRAASWVACWPARVDSPVNSLASWVSVLEPAAVMSLSMSVPSVRKSFWLAANPALKSTWLVEDDDLPDPHPVTAMDPTIPTTQTSLPEITRARYRTTDGSAAASRSIFSAMSGDDPSVEELRQRQRRQERLEQEQIAHADTGAEADRHRRRAEKAAYLRSKLEQRQRAERDVDDDPDLPPAA